ncbi:MAG: SusC/RagA family TonB-linked outer membrane protein [Bacteroidota bacterium]
MRRWASFLCLTLLGLGVMSSSAFAQNRTITGKITDSNSGDPIPGVTVIVQGTNTGALTDDTGNYSVPVTTANPTLIFSFIGFQRQEIVVGSKTTINVSMASEDVTMDDVVITALGVARETKSLGYSVTEVDGDELTEARELNVINSLSGKVAGVNINQTAGGPGASTRVIIRGNSSLAGNNQPLYVVDGIPMDNSNLGSAGMWGGKDLGDGISSINPDDIETISVLKGPSATALYGTRAQNGVILITTKKGTARQGLGVEINSNYVVEQPLVNAYDEFQQVYGSGARGMAPSNIDEAIDWARTSWGAKMDGQNVVNWDGVERPYTPHPNNLSDFYNNGQTFTNTVALTGGNETATFRFSMSDLRNEGLVPESGLNRNTFTLRGSSRMGKLSTDVKINYVREHAINRPSLSDTPENPGLVLKELASSIDQATLQDYQYDPNNTVAKFDDLKTRKIWNSSIFRSNPYWGVYEQTNEDFKDRLIGFATLRYDITDWLAIQGRFGTDYYTFRQTDIDGYGTSYVPLGRMSEREWRIRENNADVLIMLNYDFGDISVSGNLGGNAMSQHRENFSLSGNDFNIPDLQTVGNTGRQNFGYGISEKKINSLYGSAQIGYRDYLYLDLTARNDWSSTLPEENRSYFYPSASLSFVFSDAFNLTSNALSFGKLRASYAQVGGDTDPYQLDLTYQIVGQNFMGNPQGQIAQGRIPAAGLVPTLTNSTEFGLDVRFFQNRLGVDFAYYDMRTSNQILATTISGTSGYGSVTVNAGEIRNSGVELLVTGSPVQSKNSGGFNWDIAFNFARNRNEVISLDSAGQLPFLRLGESRQRNAWIDAIPGEAYGAIVGKDYARDAQGRVIHDAEGYPLASDTLSTLGIGVPSWTAGITNTFTFKGFTLSALVDIRWGGQLHSMTNLQAYSQGRHINTLEGREEWYAGTGGYVGEGVTESGEANNVTTDPQEYFSRVATNIVSEFIYDADFAKLRQLTFGYTIPRSKLAGTFIQGLNISFVGRNLAILHKKVPNVDPESNYNNGNAQGFEYGTIPMPRSFGFNINLKL